MLDLGRSIDIVRMRTQLLLHKTLFIYFPHIFFFFSICFSTLFKQYSNQSYQKMLIDCFVFLSLFSFSFLFHNFFFSFSSNKFRSWNPFFDIGMFYIHGHYFCLQRKQQKTHSILRNAIEMSSKISSVSI